MIKANEEKLIKYVEYLRTLLDEPNLLTDEEVLVKFRACFCCGEEVITASEQMHSILEFDSPKRIHKKLYENIKWKILSERYWLTNKNKLHKKAKFLSLYVAL